MFFQSQYLQDVRGHSAVLSGLMILPITVPMVFISPLSGRLIGRFGARRPDDRRHGLRVVGLLVLTQVEADSPYGLLLAGYLPFGIALGFVYAPMSIAAMAAMPAEKVGIASGVLAMNRVMAGTHRAGRHRRRLARPARRRQRLRGRDRRLDLDPRRALRGSAPPSPGCSSDDVRTPRGQRSAEPAPGTPRFHL